MARRICLFAGSMIFLLGACSNDASPPTNSMQEQESAPRAAHIGVEGTRPEVHQGKEAENGGAIESWDAYISLQAASDAMYLRELDERYFGVLSFVSGDERDYLLKSGFPTPEEWLEASRLTDGDLRARADAGDAKAAGMLADRMSVRLKELMVLGEEDPGAVTDADRVRVATMAVNYSAQAMQNSSGPFGLYVEGMVKSSIFNSWEPMTAAMLESMRRGDPRAQRLIRQLHAKYPHQDISAIYASFNRMAPRRP